jgi:hypothetical protein
MEKTNCIAAAPQARLAMHQAVVDVFLVQESNFTNSGSARPLELGRRLAAGWLPGHRAKLRYLPRTHAAPGLFK